jgi:hypothetical protein
MLAIAKKSKLRINITRNVHVERVSRHHKDIQESGSEVLPDQAHSQSYKYSSLFLYLALSYRKKEFSGTINNWK